MVYFFTKEFSALKSRTRPLVNQFMSRSWTGSRDHELDHEMSFFWIIWWSCSWAGHELITRSWTVHELEPSAGAVRSTFFCGVSRKFFFVDFKNMVVKGTFTISGGKTPSIQQGFVTTWGQTNSQSTIFELRQISFLKNSLMKNSFIHCRFKSLVYHLRFHCSNYVQNYQTM